MLQVQESSFKYVLYTHMTDQSRQLLPADRTDALGLMAVTETVDGYIVYGKRSAKLATMPSHWHCVPAGHLSSAESRAVLEQELQEELDCDWSTARSVKALAV